MEMAPSFLFATDLLVWTISALGAVGSADFFVSLCSLTRISQLPCLFQHIANDFLVFEWTENNQAYILRALLSRQAEDW
jgi:hypothetical protein